MTMNCSNRLLLVNDCLEFVKRDDFRFRQTDKSCEIVQNDTSRTNKSFDSLSQTHHSCAENDEEIDSLSSKFHLPIIEPRLLAFTESLIISVKSDDFATGCIPKLIDINDNYNVVGGICINITAEKDLLNTFIAAQYSSQDNTPKCIEIVSVCDRNLKLENEKKVDTTCEANFKKEKSLMVYLDEATNKYVGVRKNISQSIRKRQRAEICINGTLILYGGNLLLLRYIATINFSGHFQAWTLDMDGHICLSHYHVEPPQLMFLNKKRYNIIKITRIIQQSKQQFLTRTENTHEIYHYLPTGHLIKYESCFSEFIWHINPLSKLPPQTVAGTSFSDTFTRNDPGQWKNDAELLAMYLDKKNDLQRKYRKKLLYKRPAIKSIIRDYVMCLLHNKPEHILDFTIEYFIALKEKNETSGIPRRVNRSESNIDGCV